MPIKTLLSVYSLPDLAALKALSNAQGRADGSLRFVRSLPDNEPESLYAYRATADIAPLGYLVIAPDDGVGLWVRIGNGMHYDTINPTIAPPFRGIIWVNSSNGTVWANYDGTASGWVQL